MNIREFSNVHVRTVCQEFKITIKNCTIVSFPGNHNIVLSVITEPFNTIITDSIIFYPRFLARSRYDDEIGILEY